MHDSTQRRILTALLIPLKPIARALLRAGIGHREFAEVSKSAFVEVASKDYGIRGRPTNISRVAVMTGLTRKEVKRIRDNSKIGILPSAPKSTPMSSILHRWYTDAQYLNSKGKPKELSFDGGGASFAGLVRKYGGDIPPGAMRTELARIEAIEETSDGRLRVLKRNVSNLEVNDRIINGLENQLYPAALAFAHNTANEDSMERWIQRSVTTKFVRETDIARVRRISADRLTEFSTSIDDFFAAYETLYDEEDAKGSTKAVGVGLFYFEEDKNETDIFP